MIILGRRGFQCITGRSFCSSITVESRWSQLWLSRSFSELVEGYKAIDCPKADRGTSLQLLRHCIELKGTDDPKFRGRIPREIVHTIVRGIEPHVERLGADDIVTLVTGLSGNNDSVDEYLMFLIAKRVPSISASLGADCALWVLEVYCGKGICDQDSLSHLAQRLLDQSSGASIKHLIAALRALSLVRFRHQSLLSRIVEGDDLDRIHSKDAVVLLGALSELDVSDPEVISKLWHRVWKHKLIFSHQEEFGILSAFLMTPHRCDIVNRTLAKISSEKRMQRRLGLLRDCVAAGIIQQDAVDLPFQRSKSRKNPGMNMSSGLHLEVVNTLESMGIISKLEVPSSSFILDIVISPQ